jgi:CubicO group peptidase (beta-lactamase class C family)
VPRPRRGAATRAALAALALLAMPLAAQPRDDAAIDSLMAAYAAPGYPGASVLVVQGGRVAFVKGYGLAEVESGRPVTPATNFRLASLSKQFTATAVMLLAAEGKLRWDDPIASLLPGLPAYAHGVTVRHLLNHTSGLPDYERFVPDSQTRQVHDAEIPGLLARDSALKFAPGTRYAYSNSGYVLLALLVERVGGKPFPDFLRERVFAPLGMAGTVAHVDGRDVVPERAYGYSVRNGVRRTDQSNTSATLGDGGIYASAADLARWDAAVERHALVSAEAQRLAWTPPAVSGGPGGPFADAGYGFGWFVDTDRGTVRLRHHGESRGFTNAVVRYPERRLAVWVLTNRTGGAPWEIAQRIADRYLGR